VIRERMKARIPVAAWGQGRVPLPLGALLQAHGRHVGKVLLHEDFLDGVTEHPPETRSGWTRASTATPLTGICRARSSRKVSNRVVNPVPSRAQGTIT
jgi:hypothetical protein